MILLEILMDGSGQRVAEKLETVEWVVGRNRLAFRVVSSRKIKNK